MFSGKVIIVPQHVGYVNRYDNYIKKMLVYDLNAFGVVPLILTFQKYSYVIKNSITWKTWMPSYMLQVCFDVRVQHT